MKPTIGTYIVVLVLIAAALMVAGVTTLVRWFRAANARINALLDELLAAHADLPAAPAQTYWCCCGCGKDTGALELLYVDEVCAARAREAATEAALAAYPVPMPRTTAQFKPNPALARRFM